MKIEYVAVSDAYYEHWILEQGGSGKLHHFCRHGLRTCQRKVGQDQLVHVQKCAYITEEDVEACLKQWKARRLDTTVPGRKRRDLEPARSDRGSHDDSLQATPTSKASPNTPGDSQGRDRRRRGDAEESSQEDRDVGRSNACPRRSTRRSRRSSQTEEEGSPSPHRCRPEEARGSAQEEGQKI